MPYRLRALPAVSTSPEYLPSTAFVDAANMLKIILEAPHGCQHHLEDNSSEY
jgi:hypothetical protein